MAKSKNDATQPVTAIFNWTVMPGRDAQFQAAMHKVHQAAKTFPGHMGITTLKLPGGNKFITVLRFDTPDHIHAWMVSAARQDLIAKVYENATLDTGLNKTGLETWFELPGQAFSAPPKWKMLTVTFVAIYPLSILFNIYVAPHLLSWPVVLRSLVFSIVAPALLTYLLLPFLTQKVFKRWLYPGQ